MFQLQLKYFTKFTTIYIYIYIFRNSEGPLPVFIGALVPKVDIIKNPHFI